MKTKVAVTAQNKKTIFEHAGRCRNYFIYTINNNIVESKTLLQLTQEETLHNLFQENNSNKENILFDVDIILTRGIGNGAIQKLALHNVVCYKVEETDPDVAIEKLINGTLEAVAPISYERSGCNCGGGHGHNHSHNHHHHH